MQCPHCGNEIPDTAYVEPNNGPSSFFIPFDVTGCAPAPNYNSIVTCAAAQPLNIWNTVCSGAGVAGAAQPLNITYLARGSIEGE